VIEPGPAPTVPLVCEFRTNDPKIAEMLNMIEAIPRFTAEREEMLGHLHLQMAALCFKHAGQHQAREHDRDMRRRRQESQ
jgi:hypothetical protein